MFQTSYSPFACQTHITADVVNFARSVKNMFGLVPRDHSFLVCRGGVRARRRGVNRHAHRFLFRARITPLVVLAMCDFQPTRQVRVASELCRPATASYVCRVCASFCCVRTTVCPFLLHAFLRQARIRTAVRARTARRDYEVLFKGMKARQLAGQVRARASQASKRFARRRVRGCGACCMYTQGLHG